MIVKATHLDKENVPFDFPLAALAKLPSSLKLQMPFGQIQIHRIVDFVDFRGAGGDESGDFSELLGQVLVVVVEARFQLGTSQTFAQLCSKVNGCRNPLIVLLQSCKTIRPLVF